MAGGLRKQDGLGRLKRVSRANGGSHPAEAGSAHAR